jgi:hypothetical protein
MWKQYFVQKEVFNHFIEELSYMVIKKFLKYSRFSSFLSTLTEFFFFVQQLL